MARTALVTGATGFVGAHLTRALLDRGFVVRVLVRAPERLRVGNVDVVVGDLADEGASLDRALSDCDVVYHCAGVVGDRVEWARANAVNVEGTRRLALAARRANVRRFVHVSSVAVYGFDRGSFSEDQPRRTVGEPYIDTKSAGEEVCENAFADSPSALVILRPSIIYGPNDLGMIPRLIELLRSRVPMIGDGHTPVGLVHVSDVVRALVAACDHEGDHRTFNVTGPGEDITWAALVAWLTERFNLPRPRHLPVLVARALAYLMAALSAVRLAPRPPPLTAFAVKFLTEDRRYPSARLQTALGVTPRVSVTMGLQETFGYSPALAFGGRPDILPG